MRRLTALLAALLLLAFTGCAANPAQPESTSSPAQADETQADFQVESAYPLEYAKEFTVDECTGGTRLITIQNARYLVVPENSTVPNDLSEDITVLQKPLENVYLVSTSAMDPILKLDARSAVMVVLLGAALSVAGYLLQTFFANPIAGPFVMGVSGGAKLAVALTMVVLLNHGLFTSSLTLILASFVGAMVAMGFVLAVSQRVKRAGVLVICGVMISYICSAVTDVVVAFAQDSNIVNLHNWSMGSFSGMTWENVLTAALIVLPCLALSFMLSKPMAAYQMGEAYAQSVGVSVRPFSVALVLLSSLLAACVTAFAGPISFVGIAVPHLVKRTLRSAKPLHVLPGCVLGGAAFCLLCDLIARSIFAPTELSVSSVTAIFGAPVVILLLVRKQRREAAA